MQKRKCEKISLASALTAIRLVAIMAVIKTRETDMVYISIKMTNMNQQQLIINHDNELFVLHS